MSKQFAFALCVTTVLGGTQSVYAETPKLLEEGRDGKHIAVKKKNGKFLSFKRKSIKKIPQVASTETGKVTPQLRKRQKKILSFKRKSLERVPQVTSTETGKVTPQLRKKQKKFFSFKRKSLRRIPQIASTETGKMTLQLRKRQKKFFSFKRNSLRKIPQIATIPFASSIQPVRNGHMVLKSLTSKTPLSQYREERKVIRTHPSVQNIVFFSRLANNASLVKQIVRDNDKPTISRVTAPAANVKVSNNPVTNRQTQTTPLEPAATRTVAYGEGVNDSNKTVDKEIVVPATSALVSAHIVAPVAEARASNDEVDNEIVLQPEISALVSTHAVVSETPELVETHMNTSEEEGSAANGSEGSQTLLSSVIPELFSEHEDASASDEKKIVVSENPESVATHTDIPEEDVIAANGSEGSQTLLSSVIPELFSEHEDASGIDETVMSENPESVATYTDISEEDVSTTNGSNGGETVLSELSDLLSTHVVDPMQEVFGLNSSHDDIAHEEEQPTSELVSAHTDTPEEEASAANGSNGGEAVLSELSDLLSAHVIDPMQEVFGLNSSHDDTAHEEEQPTSELVSAHTDTPAEEASAANGSEWGQAILSLVTPPLFSGHTDTSEGEVSAGNGSGENPRIPSSALFSERTDTHTGENDASSEGQTILSLVTPPLFSDHADTLEGEVRVDNDSEENSRIPSSALFREHTDTRTGENDASDGEEDLGLSSLFTDHAEDLEDKNLQTTSDGLNLSSESSTDTSLDDVLASLYGNDEEPALFMNHEDSLLQLSSILSGKEPTSSASNSFLHVSEDFAPNSDLFTIQEEISKIILNTGDFYHQMSANDFEDALLKLQDFQRNAANLAIRLNEVENLANEDQSLLGQITQVRKLLQDKAQQLLDLQARVDYVSQKREREKLNSDQMGEISTDSVSALSTSQDGSNGFSIGTNYHMRAMSPQESFYHLSSLLSGKTSEPSYGSQILQQEESNPILFDIQEEVRDIHPNIGELYHQLSPAEFEDARLQLESLQGKAANLVVMLNEVEEQWQENGNEDLLEQISYVKKTLQDKAQQLLDLQIRMDHISKQREDGEKRRLEEQSLSSGQIEGSMGGTGTDDMTNQHPQIHSDALPPTEITADETAGSSISIPSVSSEESSKFAEFSTHLTALTSLFEVNLDRLGTLGDSQKASNKGLFTAKLVKFLQNNLYDQAQTLGLQTSFEKFEEEKVLSYDEALSALPHLLQFASSIQVEAVINLSTLTSYIKLLNNFLGQFVRSLNDDQAQ